jgi:hypothetical protein
MFSAAGVLISWAWFFGFLGFVIFAMIAMFWLGLQYERRSEYAAEQDPGLRTEIWKDGYAAAVLDAQRDARYLADTVAEYGPAADERDPDDSLAERVVTTGEMSLLSAQLESKLMIDSLDGWADRVLADIWGPDLALAAVPNGAHHHE